MTKQDQLNFIREKCIEANPEIATVVQMPTWHCLYCGLDQPHWHRTKQEEQPERSCLTCQNENPDLPKKEKVFFCPFHNSRGERAYRPWIEREGSWIVPRGRSEYETIRPIRLADVLLATSHESDDGFAISTRGHFLILGEYRWEVQINKWNLRADDLQEQSEETVEFIYQLLA